MNDPIRPERISVEAYLARRRSRLERRVGCRLVPPPPPGLPAPNRRFLREEAEELYWNELSWASLAVRAEGAGIEPESAPKRAGAAASPAFARFAAEGAERVFAAFLTFVDGLLPGDAGSGQEMRLAPRPGVVEDVLSFLADRCLEGGDADDPVAAHERALTSRLLDLVLYRLHALATTARPTGRPPRAGDSGPAHVGGDG